MAVSYFTFCISFLERSMSIEVSIELCNSIKMVLTNSKTGRNICYLCCQLLGARGDVVVKTLRYKPAGRGIDSRWCHLNFSVT
jgi:hypothetical protein